jgi:transcriptional regulator with XRE-family HTH domain
MTLKVEAIPQALRLLRLWADRTPSDCERRSGISRHLISKWELGRALPSLECLIQHLASLDRDFGDLQRAIEANDALDKPRLERRLLRDEGMMDGFVGWLAGDP